MATATQLALTDRHRLALYDSMRGLILPNAEFDRRLVSFQANRGVRFFSWLKYKEAFSAQLVERLLADCEKQGVLLDPFAGVGTSLFVARSRGWDSIGIELLPVGFFAIQARLAAEKVDVAALKRKVTELERFDWNGQASDGFAFAHIPITAGAFSRKTERQIARFRAFVDKRVRNPMIRQLLSFVGMTVLESASYTRKDGQYLRWDHRAKKPRVKATFDKGEIKDFGDAVLEKLRQVAMDISQRGQPRESLFEEAAECEPGLLDVRQGSCLDVLPDLEGSSVDCVVTSPPYCNRYDYTRTYALELVYLGLAKEEVNRLRQSMLSCTVENRAKDEQLRSIYERRGNVSTFRRVMAVFSEQSALHEVLDLLFAAAKRGEINNVNVPRMVRNYFLEMCFVVYELARVLRPGGRVVMVNDNVRYIGEEVPVDLVLSDFARSFGLRVERIWTLPRGKGNSSQQMGAHGRSELRKCVYVWVKCGRVQPPQVGRVTPCRSMPISTINASIRPDAAMTMRCAHN
jgi:hypothetical protein